MKSLITTKVFIVGLLWLTPLFAQLKEFDVHKEPPAATIPVFPENPDDAAVIIHSSLPDLNFESNMGGIVSDKSVPAEGRYVLIIKTFKQAVTIKANGYREFKLILKARDPKTVEYYSIETRKNPGSLIVTSVPEGATVTIAEMPDTSFIAPAIINDLDPMPYKLTLSKANFIRRDTVITVEAGIQSQIALVLPAQQGFLTVTSDPKNADVYLNGKKSGATPFNAPVAAGSYTVEIRKENFVTQSKQLAVVFNKKAAAEFDLTSKFALQAKTWRSMRLITLIGTAVTGGGALGCAILANSADKTYHNSTDSDKILQAKQDVIRYDRVTLGSGIAAGTFAVWTMVNHLQARRLENADKKLSVAADPFCGRILLTCRF